MDHFDPVIEPGMTVIVIMEGSDFHHRLGRAREVAEATVDIDFDGSTQPHRALREHVFPVIPGSTVEEALQFVAVTQQAADINRSMAAQFLEIIQGHTPEEAAYHLTRSTREAIEDASLRIVTAENRLNGEGACILTQQADGSYTYQFDPPDCLWVRVSRENMVRLMEMANEAGSGGG